MVPMCSKATLRLSSLPNDYEVVGSNSNKGPNNILPAPR